MLTGFLFFYNKVFFITRITYSVVSLIDNSISFYLSYNFFGFRAFPIELYLPLSVFSLSTQSPTIYFPSVFILTFYEMTQSSIYILKVTL